MAVKVMATDGSDFSGVVTIYITKDNAQAIGTVGSGLMTNRGNGVYTYLPSAAETNGVHLAWCGACTGGFSNMVQTYTDGDISVIDFGTAQSAGATNLVLAAASAFGDDEIVGATLVILSATTGAKQSRQIIANVGSTDTVTVDPWITTPTGTIVYAIFATPPSSAISLPAVNIEQVNGDSVGGSGTSGDPWGPGA